MSDPDIDTIAVAIVKRCRNSNGQDDPSIEKEALDALERLRVRLEASSRTRTYNWSVPLDIMRQYGGHND